MYANRSQQCSLRDGAAYIMTESYFVNFKRGASYTLSDKSNRNKGGIQTTRMIPLKNIGTGLFGHWASM